MVETSGRTLRKLAHAVLTADECTIFKTALRHYRVSKSLPALHTSLRPVVSSDTKALLLVELALLLPRQHAGEWIRLCSPFFTQYPRAVLIRLRRCGTADEALAYLEEGRVHDESGNSGSQHWGAALPEDPVLLLRQVLELSSKDSARRPEHATQTFDLVQEQKAVYDKWRSRSVGRLEGVSTSTPGEYEHGVVQLGHVSLPPGQSVLYAGQTRRDRSTSPPPRQAGPRQAGPRRSHSVVVGGPKRLNRSVVLDGHRYSHRATGGVRELGRPSNFRGVTLLEQTHFSGRQIWPEEPKPDLPSHPGNWIHGSTPATRVTRRLVLRRKRNEALGFCLAGGRGEAQAAVRVSSVVDGSQAHLRGLRVGDRVVQVGDQSTLGLSRQEVGDVILRSRELILTLASHQPAPAPLTAAPAVSGSSRATSARDSGVISDAPFIPTPDYTPRDKAKQNGVQGLSPRPAEINFVIPMADSHGYIGCAFTGGFDCREALQVESVDPRSRAHQAGVRPGDLVVKVSGRDVRAATHSEAMTLLNTARHHLTLTVHRHPPTREQKPSHVTQGPKTSTPTPKKKHEVRHEYIPPLSEDTPRSSRPRAPNTSPQPSSRLPSPAQVLRHVSDTSNRVNNTRDSVERPHINGNIVPPLDLGLDSSDDETLSGGEVTDGRELIRPGHALEGQLILEDRLGGSIGKAVQRDFAHHWPKSSITRDVDPSKSQVVNTNGHNYIITSTIPTSSEISTGTSPMVTKNKPSDARTSFVGNSEDDHHSQLSVIVPQRDYKGPRVAQVAPTRRPAAPELSPRPDYDSDSDDTRPDDDDHTRPDGWSGSVTSGSVSSGGMLRSSSVPPPGGGMGGCHRKIQYKIKDQHRRVMHEAKMRLLAERGLVVGRKSRPAKRSGSDMSGGKTRVNVEFSRRQRRGVSVGGGKVNGQTADADLGKAAGVSGEISEVLGSKV